MTSLSVPVITWVNVQKYNLQTCTAQCQLTGNLSRFSPKQGHRFQSKTRAPSLTHYQYCIVSFPALSNSFSSLHPHSTLPQSPQLLFIPLLLLPPPPSPLSLISFPSFPALPLKGDDITTVHVLHFLLCPWKVVINYVSVLLLMCAPVSVWCMLSAAVHVMIRFFFFNSLIEFFRVAKTLFFLLLVTLLSTTSTTKDPA